MGIANISDTWAIVAASFFGLLLAVYLGLRVYPLVVQAWKQKDHPWSAHASSPETPAVTDRRRSIRYDILLPISVYGSRDNAEPFFEDAMSLQVSAHGGLLVLASRVRVGQELVLKTCSAQSKFQVCQVARLGVATHLRTTVAVQFAHPAAEFWQAAEAAKASLMSGL
jgi:hypothetical protein